MQSLLLLSVTSQASLLKVSLFVAERSHICLCSALCDVGLSMFFVTVTLPEGRHHRAALFSPPRLEYHRCNTRHQVDGAEDILSGNGSFHQQSRCRMSGYCAIWSSKKPGDFESDVWGLQWLQMLRLNQNSRTRFSHCMYLPRTPFSGQNDSNLNGHMANLHQKRFIVHKYVEFIVIVCSALMSLVSLTILFFSFLPHVVPFFVSFSYFLTRLHPQALLMIIFLDFARQLARKFREAPIWASRNMTNQCSLKRKRFSCDISGSLR